MLFRLRQSPVFVVNTGLLTEPGYGEDKLLV